MQAQRGVLLLSHYTVNKEDDGDCDDNDGDCDIEKASAMSNSKRCTDFWISLSANVGIILPSLDFLDFTLGLSFGFQFGPQVGIDLEFGFQFRP